MKIAVLMSTYNGEEYIRQQIDSVLAQQCACEFELLVRDDGSVDGTKQILEEYREQGKLKWYCGKNLGPAKSFLDLVRRSPGYDYYAFADQDDYWYPDKLQKGVAQIKGRSGPALSCANARLVDGALQPLGRDVYRIPPHVDFYSVTCSGGLMGCTMVFNRELAQLIQNKPLPQELIMHDFYLAVVCTLHDGIIMYDDAAYMDYRQHGSNVVGSSWKKTDALKNRIQILTEKNPNTLDKMADSICRNYPDAPNPEKLRWLKGVSQYRKSVFRALKLAVDPKPAYNSLNMAVTLRLAFMLRNG